VRSDFANAPFRLESVLLGIIAVGLVLQPLAGGDDGGSSSIARTETPDGRKTLSTPSYRDQFSGKTVTDKDMAWDLMAHREGNAPRVGEVAPNFSLRSATDGRVVSLKELHRDQPVVLILSSWGCDIFRETLAGLQALYTEYSDRARFVMIYIREAHPYDGFAGALGRVEDPKTFEARAAVARKSRLQMRLPFTVLVDSMEDPTATRWAGWPIRLFVVGKDGKVAYAGAQGPWGYRPYPGFRHGNGKLVGLDREFSSETLEEFLEKHLPSGASSGKSAE